MATRRKLSTLSTETYESLVRSETELVPSPWALIDVRYLFSGGTRRLKIVFCDRDAPSLVVPVDHIWELAGASTKELRALRLSVARDTIISDALNAHISVEGLIRDIQCADRERPEVNRYDDET